MILCIIFAKSKILPVVTILLQLFEAFLEFRACISIIKRSKSFKDCVPCIRFLLCILDSWYRLATNEKHIDCFKFQEHLIDIFIKNFQQLVHHVKTNNLSYSLLVENSNLCEQSSSFAILLILESRMIGIQSISVMDHPLKIV